jgi:hypothetical protein
MFDVKLKKIVQDCFKTETILDRVTDFNTISKVKIQIRNYLKWDMQARYCKHSLPAKLSNIFSQILQSEINNKQKVSQNCTSYPIINKSVYSGYSKFSRRQNIVTYPHPLKCHNFQMLEAEKASKTLGFCSEFKQLVAREIL